MLNPADPNIGIDYSFCEFTFDQDQVYANITYVDFVPRLPISLTLKGADNPKDVQHVSGMRAEAFEGICEALREQTRKDGYPWARLVVNGPGTDTPLRILSPMHGKSVDAPFDGYYEKYVDAVWDYYREGTGRSNPDGSSKGGHELLLDSQTSYGILKGVVDRNTELFTFYPSNKSCCVGCPDTCMPNDPEVEVFYKPSTADILSCNSGPFLNRNRPMHNSIVPRLAAGFQRSTLLLSSFQPSADTTVFYTNDVTNHYARVVHDANLDGKGYAFAYDDVQSTCGSDQSGKVNMANPGFFKVAVGGMNKCVGTQTPQESGENNIGARPSKARAQRNVRFPMYSTTTNYRAKDAGSRSGSASWPGSSLGGTPEGSSGGAGSVHSANGNEAIDSDKGKGASGSGPFFDCHSVCTGSSQADHDGTDTGPAEQPNAADGSAGNTAPENPDNSDSNDPAGNAVDADNAHTVERAENLGYGEQRPVGFDLTAVERQDWDGIWHAVIDNEGGHAALYSNLGGGASDRDIAVAHVEEGEQRDRVDKFAGHHASDELPKRSGGCCSVFRCWRK